MPGRLTRSHRVNGLRRTRRRQKGGAAWYKPISKYFSSSEPWKTKLLAAGLEEDVVDGIMQLFNVQKGGATPVANAEVAPVTNGVAPVVNAEVAPVTNAEVPNAEAPVVNAEVSPVTNGVAPNGLVKAWLDANKYQDTLMKTGLEIVMEELDMTGDESAIIAKLTAIDSPEFVTSLRSMFQDLEKIISLGHEGTNFETGDAAGNHNKFEMMFRNGDDLKKELSKLMLNPARIQNLLVKSVAEVIVMLQEEGVKEEIVQSLSNDLLRDILINKWSLFSLDYITSQSNDMPRDCLVTAGQPTTLEGIKEFWQSFVESLTKTDALEFIEPEAGSEISALNKNLGRLAAEYAKAPAAIYDVLATLPEVPGLLESNRAEVPDELTDDLFKRLHAQTVLFLKHLEGSVKAVKP